MVPRPHRHVEVPNRSTIFGYIGEGSLCGGKTKFAMFHDTLVMMVPKEFDPKTCGRPPRRVPNAHRQERPRGISREDWKRRYIMWSRYDEGIEMDRAAWFEVTPENIARFTAEEIYARYGDATEVVDGCAGVGGNAIQFALQSRGRGGGQVVACDISEARLEVARHNAAVYGVAEGKVKYVEGDVRACKPSDTKSLLFLSPPWGGPSCYSTPVYDPASCELTDWATSPACRFNRVVLYLPRHTDLNALVEMCMRAGPIPLLEILVIRYTSPEPHTKALLVFIDRSASPRLPVPPLLFWRGSVAAALLRTLMTKPPLTGALGSMAASAAGEKMDVVADLTRCVSERLGLRREEVLEELDRLRRREINLRRVAAAVRETERGKDGIGKLLGNSTDCLGVRALLSMATTVSSSSSTTSAPPSKSTAAEGHAAEQANHNMRFLQYRSSQNSSRVGANYQAVVPLVLPSKERKEITLRQKEIGRPDEKRRSPKLTELAAGLCDTIMQRSSAGPFLQADVDTVMDALEARGPLPAAVVSGRKEADWYEESTMVSSLLSARTLRRNQWQVEEVRGLGRGLEGLERWKREAEAVVGGERKLTLPEATALWSEGRVLEKIFDGLHPQVAALHRLISPAEAFEARVLQDRWQKEEREQLVKEGEALQVLPAKAIRHLSSTDASTTVKPTVSSSATPALSEWTDRAKAKLEGKRSRVPLHVVMELLDDLNARGLADNETTESSEIVGVLEEARDAGMAWRERASRALAVDDAQLSGKGLVEGVECGGALSVVGLRELWEEHYQLPRVCVPEVCRRLESLMRRAMAWEERCHRLLEGVPRSAVEGRMVLEEIRQSGIAKAVDLSKCLNSVKAAVERGEEWERRAERAVEAWEVGYTRKICVSCDRLSIDEQGPSLSPKAGSGAGRRGPAFVENLLEELRWQVALYDREIRENLDFLPSSRTFVELRDSGKGLNFRDEVLYSKICRVADGVDAWEARVKQLTSPSGELAVFPRPAGGLRALSFFFMDYMRTGIVGTKAGDLLDDLLTAMREEVWAWDVRREVSTMPLTSSSLEELSGRYPSRLKALQRAEETMSPLVTPPSQEPAQFDQTLLEIEKACTSLIESLPVWEERWQVSLEKEEKEAKVEDSKESSSSTEEAVADFESYRVRDSTCVGEWDLISTLTGIESAARGLLGFTRPIEISGWQHLSRVIREIDSGLVRVPELVAKIDDILTENSELERRTLHLVQRMEKSRVEAREQDVKEEPAEAPTEKVESQKRKATEEAESSLFGQLLELLAAVDRSRSRVAAFESSLRSLVNTLLEWQRRARELFHWDENEKRMEGASRPSLEAVCEYVRELDEDPVLKDMATRDFLAQVGFISGALAAEEAAREWQQELADLLAKREADSAAQFSLNALRKLMAQLDAFDVDVPVDGQFVKAAAEADQ
ncbi:Trimethylguanosine synthase, partial [Perkinsus olseni]